MGNFSTSNIILVTYFTMFNFKYNIFCSYFSNSLGVTLGCLRHPVADPGLVCGVCYLM